MSFAKKKVRQGAQSVSPMVGDDDTADQPGPSGAQKFVTEGQLQHLLQALSMTLPQAHHGVQQHPQQSKAEKKTQKQIMRITNVNSQLPQGSSKNVWTSKKNNQKEKKSELNSSEQRRLWRKSLPQQLVLLHYMRA